jgi:signal transduction histidine kinase
VARAPPTVRPPFGVGKDVEAEVRGPETVLVDGHSDLPRVLLRNLVDNAIRYSPRASTVSVDVDRVGDDGENGRGLRVVVVEFAGHSAREPQRR